MIVKSEILSVNDFIKRLQTEFKASYNDVGQLYTKGVINPAAKYKPIRLSDTTITDAKRKQARCGFDTIPDVSISEHRPWTYLRPRGKATNNEYFRREDLFSDDGTKGYDTSAVFPIKIPTDGVYYPSSGEMYVYLSFPGAISGWNSNYCMALSDCLGDLYSDYRYLSIVFVCGSRFFLMTSGVSIKSIQDNNTQVFPFVFNIEDTPLYNDASFKRKPISVIACLSTMSLSNGTVITGKDISGNTKQFAYITDTQNSALISQYGCKSLEMEKGLTWVDAEVTITDSISGIKGSIKDFNLTYTGTVDYYSLTWKVYKLGKITGTLIAPSSGWNRTYVNIQVTIAGANAAQGILVATDLLKEENVSNELVLKRTVSLKSGATFDDALYYATDVVDDSGHKLEDYKLYVPSTVTGSFQAIVSMFAYNDGEDNVILTPLTKTYTL